MFSVGSLEGLSIIWGTKFPASKTCGIAPGKNETECLCGISKVSICAFSALVLSEEYGASNNYQSVSLLRVVDGFSDESTKLAMHLRSFSLLSPMGAYA